jgi:hypothetical protein
LTVETVTPRAISSGITAVISIVLPLPLHPQRPKTLIANSRFLSQAAMRPSRGRLLATYQSAVFQILRCPKRVAQIVCTLIEGSVTWGNTYIGASHIGPSPRVLIRALNGSDVLSATCRQQGHKGTS